MKTTVFIVAVSIGLAACQSPSGSVPTIGENVGTQPPPPTQTRPPQTPTLTRTQSPTPSPTASETPTGGGGGHIAFASDRDGTFRIYMLDVTSGQARPLSNEGQSAEIPVWSPNGAELAYDAAVQVQRAFHRHLFVLNPFDDSAPKEITDSMQDIDPTWSPDGLHIAFLSSRSGSWGLYTMTPEGDDIELLEDGLGFINRPFWSPSGDVIVLSSADNLASDFELMLGTAGTNGTTNLTNNDANEFDPAWAPNGSTLAFDSDRSGNWDLYILSPDGSNERQLTDTPINEVLPQWSPDGQWIAFQARVEGNTDIYIVGPDGTQLQRVTDDPAPDMSPAWSPDGRYIAFVTLRNEPSWRDCEDSRFCNSDIYIVELATGETTQLTDEDKGDVSPTWQPSLHPRP